MKILLNIEIYHKNERRNNYFTNNFEFHGWGTIYMYGI